MQSQVQVSEAHSQSDRARSDVSRSAALRITDQGTFKGFRSILAGAARHLDPTLAAPIVVGVVAAFASLRRCLRGNPGMSVRWAPGA
jgi:hypothetical protein